MSPRSVPTRRPAAGFHRLLRRRGGGWTVRARGHRSPRFPERRRGGRDARRRRERGQALIVALFVLLLVSLAVALVAVSVDSAMRGVRHELRSLKLTALTDAALAEALAHLAQSPTFAGSGEHPFGGGVLGSQVLQVGSKRWRVESWARYRGLVRRVRVDVRQTVDGYAISGWRRVENRF